MTLDNPSNPHSAQTNGEGRSIPALPLLWNFESATVAGDQTEMVSTGPLLRLQPLLISTKFEPPRIGTRHILRSKLLEALRASRDARITFVSGSPGFGKTVLLAQWRQELMKAGDPVAWLSLSEEEGTLVSFSAHLFEALHQLDVATPGQLLATEEMREQIEEATAVIVNSLRSVGRDIYLLIDDYHHVTDAWANRLVQKLIDHSPGNLHIVIASRIVPPLSVAKHRVMAQMVEIDCNELPFTLAETRSFLERNLSTDVLSPEETLRLHELTFGWPATLQLVAILFKNHPGGRDQMRRLAGQSADLHNYLIEEVIGGLPADLLEFMESLAICNRFNVSIARAITGDDRAAEWLARIVSENLLVIKTDSQDPAGWLRFHPLLAEFLLSRLKQRDAEELNGLHHRAAEWFDRQGLPVEAIRHFLKGHNPDAAIRIVETCLPSTWRLSHIGPLLHLVNGLPISGLSAYPRLAYLGALSLAISGAPQLAELWAEHIRVLDDPETERFRRSLVKAAIAHQRDDIAGSLSLTEVMRPPPGISAFERNAYLSYHVTGLAADGRFSEALDQYRIHRLDDSDKLDGMALLAVGCRAVALLLQGKAHEALPHALNAYERQVARRGRGSIGANLTAVTLAEALLESNRIDEAQEVLANRRHAIRQTTPFIMVSAALTASRLCMVRGASDEAMELVTSEAERFIGMGLDRGAAYMLNSQWRLLRVKRQRDAARRIERQIEDLAQRHSESRGFNAEIPMIAAALRARAALWDGEFGVATAAVATARAMACRLGRGRWIVTIDLLGAVSALKAGDENQAMDFMHASIARAAQDGLFWTFLEEGNETVQLLERFAARTDVEPALREYAEALLDQALGRRRRATNADGHDDEGVLTPREVDIVRLVEAGMSNKRIANTLAISLETVKWNLKNIFLKLDVTCRYDAMIQARKSGLLD
ncbi:LuxR C-terminal-related transcriptional regulator [Novosphingobium aquae]|uniref:LuxR C-terminal-related transcriptional regulator n=1 Tax=Novosphingobium aquae TaxID=3133435 RepID=A0ABU8S5Z9_9SPHN